MSQDILHLRNGHLSVEVSRFGGSLLAGHYRETPFLKPTRTAGLASRRFGAEASFPLVPYGNRVEANAFNFAGKHFSMQPNTADPYCLHGDGWLAEWEIMSQSGCEAVLRYSHKYASSPYAYSVLQTVRIDGDALTLSLRVTNTSRAPLPFGLGFHPFFPRTPKTRLKAEAKQFWTERSGHLPDAPIPIPENLDFTAARPLPPHWINNAYDGWNAKTCIEWPEHGLGLTVTADGPFNCFLIYSPDVDSDFFCFEPMTHLPNAHNMPSGGGLVTLEHGQSLCGGIVLHPVVLPG
ncbi:aldose 1-epimerase [Pararhizobium sp. PWRC1-1]|uniref:aldose 1-epimerase n=1 Tax=Pararhizobium sp. PWRC1-1 TaxID=2804566 RepID=UPI003CEBB78B